MHPEDALQVCFFCRCPDLCRCPVFFVVARFFVDMFPAKMTMTMTMTRMNDNDKGKKQEQFRYQIVRTSGFCDIMQCVVSSQMLFWSFCRYRQAIKDKPLLFMAPEDDDASMHDFRRIVRAVACFSFIGPLYPNPNSMSYFLLVHYFWILIGALHLTSNCVIIENTAFFASFVVIMVSSKILRDHRSLEG